MKQRYKELEMEVVAFETEDILTSSLCPVEDVCEDEGPEDT